MVHSPLIKLSYWGGSFGEGTLDSHDKQFPHTYDGGARTDRY